MRNVTIEKCNMLTVLSYLGHYCSIDFFSPDTLNYCSSYIFVSLDIVLILQKEYISTLRATAFAVWPNYLFEF